MTGVTKAFDNRDGAIWFDGKLVPWREAQLHVLTHALHYGGSVFEGERVYSGRIFKLREHSVRLMKSAELMDIPLPWTLEQIEQATEATVTAMNLREGYVRPIVWRGCEQMDLTALHTQTHMAIAAWEWGGLFSPESKMQGIRMQWSDWRRPAPDMAPTAAKAAGLYMICTIAKNKAEREGYQDALMLDWRGQIAEATGANFFMVKDGKLHTPTADCFLDGITRRTVMDLARKRGIEVVERAIFPEELADATETFLTGTAAEVTPIREIGAHTFTPGPICRLMIDDYAALVRAPALDAESLRSRQEERTG